MNRSRSYKLLLGAALLACSGLVPSARAAPEPAAQKTALSFKLLPEAGALLARPASPEVRLFSNIILPTSMIQLDNSTRESAFTLGQTKFTVSLADLKDPPAKKAEDYQRGTKDFLIKFEGGEARLKRTAPEAMSFEPITLKLDQGREYALAFPYGYSTEYTTRTLGIIPVKQQRGFLAYRSGGVQQGSVGGQTISLYDSNTDGLFRPTDDCIAVGELDPKMSVFAPIAANLATPSGVYKLQKLAEDGSAAEFVPVADKSQTVSVSFAGADLEVRVAVLSAEANCSFAASAAKGQAASVAVLPGKYALQYGMVYSPELKRVVATVAAGKLPPADAAGQSAMALGGPFTLEFKVNPAPAGGNITISSSNFRLSGKAGEDYANYTWAKEPEITLVSGAKSVAVGKMEFG